MTNAATPTAPAKSKPRRKLPPAEEYPTVTWLHQQDLPPLTAVQQALALTCLNAAYRIATRFRDHLGEEADGIALLHLTRAAVKFEKHRGTRFITAVYRYVRNGLRKATKELSAVSRGGQATTQHFSAISPEPDEYTWDPPDPRGDDQARNELREEINVLLKPLTRRERFVLEARASGDSLEAVGLRLGVSKERVRQIQAQAVAKVRKGQKRREKRLAAARSR